MKLIIIENTSDCKTFLIDANGSTVGTLTSYKNKFIIHFYEGKWGCAVLFTVDDFNESITLINNYISEVIEND